VARILRHGGLAIPEQERDDLEQEIVTEVWQAVNRSRFDFFAGFWGFVEVVTTRRCIDWLRARRAAAASLPEEVTPQEITSKERGPLQETLLRERAVLATEILAALDPECQKLIAMRMRDGLSYREISRATGRSEGALRIQLYRCIRQARLGWKGSGADRGAQNTQEGSA
jgi:RNA polymerase sigma factor (sigma-70 family)